MERDQALEKVIQIDQELCTGCGSCIDACSVGAINLINHHAEIDDILCIACEACVEACPNGAIISITAPISITPISVQPVTKPGLAFGQQSAALLETNVPARGLKPLAGAALTFIGNEVAPRLIDVLMKSIEQRLAQPKTTTISTSMPSSRDDMPRRGQRKQIRRRGGNMGKRNHRGRR